MKTKGLFLALAFMPVILPPAYAAGGTCVHTDPALALQDDLAGAPNGPQLLNTTTFLPAGASAGVIVREPFNQQSQYFVLIERQLGAGPKGKSVISLTRDEILATQLTADNPFVKEGEALPTETLLTLRTPSSISSAWKDAALYVFRCNGEANNPNPVFASTLTMPVSSAIYSNVIVWTVIVIIYLLAAVASKVVDKQNLSLWRYLDPVVLTAGSNGKGNLAKLQIVFFSLIVFGLVAYIVLRTGLLSDLSSTILLLLGIAGLSSAASKATDVTRNRIDFDNWAWFIRKNWLPPGGLSAINQARWRDIVTSDGEFDVYHFQNLIFSLVVGAALLATGISDLASFEIPQTLLGVLGLSQVVYIGGKLVAPPTCKELNDATITLRDLEQKFIAAARTNPDSNPPAGQSPNAPPQSLAAAARRAPAEYSAYKDCAENVRIMFESTTGRKVMNPDLEPSFV